MRNIFDFFKFSALKKKKITGKFADKGKYAPNVTRKCFQAKLMVKRKAQNHFVKGRVLWLIC